MALSRRFVLLFAGSVFLLSGELYGQAITASRSFVDIGPVGGECQVATCVEARASRIGICAVQVLDNSGSMNTNGRFAAARTGISQFVDSLRSDRGDWIGLVTFSGPVLTFGSTPHASPGPPSVVKQIDPLSQAFGSVKSTISGLGTASVSALTPLAAGIEAGAEVLAGCPEGSLRVMVISTDGLPNWNDNVQCAVTPNSGTSCTDAAIEAAAAAKSEGVHIVTIGIDLSAGDPSEAFGISLLKDVATSPVDANFFNTSGGLGQGDIFAHVAGGVASPSDVTFDEPLPDACWGYVPGSTSGTITDDPVIVSNAGVQSLSWNLGTVPDGKIGEICYSMAYDETCGTVPSSLSVQEGGTASWFLADGSATSVELDPQTLQSIVECSVIIPVELVDFRATSSGGDVALIWHTASESNNAGFAIERSASGAAFAEVGYVRGNGTSTVMREYRFSDRSLNPGSYRYRLRQIDFDGSFEFSPTVDVMVELPETHFMSPVFPNPLRGSARFDLSVSRTQDVGVELLDVSGRTIRTLMNGPAPAGSTQRIQVDANGLPGGTYVLRVVGENFSASKFIAVVR